MSDKAGKLLAVSHVEVKRNTGLDSLHVEGTLWEENTGSSGLLAFYANFYNASGKLLERQPFYVKDTGAGTGAELLWYIPEGCTKVILE